MLDDVADWFLALSGWQTLGIMFCVTVLPMACYLIIILFWHWLVIKRLVWEVKREGKNLHAGHSCPRCPDSWLVSDHESGCDD